MKIILLLVPCLAASLLVAPVEAQHVSLDIRNGGITVDARNVTIQEILAEWARVGGVRVINGEKIVAPPVTLLLRDLTEREALDILLRDAGGYLLFARRDGVPGSSTFEQILIVPAGTAPQAPASTAATPADLSATTAGPAEFAPAAAEPSDPPLNLSARPLAPLTQSPFGDNGPEQVAVEAEADAQETSDREPPAAGSDGPAAAQVRDTGPRPPTPMLPPSQEADARNPFGNVAGVTHPGSITPAGPPPGVVYPPVTNPDVERLRSGAVTLR